LISNFQGKGVIIYQVDNSLDRKQDAFKNSLGMRISEKMMSKEPNMFQEYQDKDI